MNLEGIEADISVDSCQYTPVYLMQNNSLTQTNSYVLSSAGQEVPKPATSNLKLFYENTGKIENSLLLNNVQYVTKPQSPNTIEPQELTGNNLKLASFLVPKTGIGKNYGLLQKNNANDMAPFEIKKAQINTKKVPKTSLNPKLLPKLKPKDVIQEPQKLTSVKLLKLGGTYHSLNNLSDEQIKLVTKALKKFSETENSAVNTTFDPATKTRFIYKVVNPKDLKVKGSSKVMITDNSTKEEVINPVMKEPTKGQKVEEKVKRDEDEKPESVEELKVTRSGRAVKFPKRIEGPEFSPTRPRKKIPNVSCSCIQCAAEFGSIYRLQRHYQKHPTHIPSKHHSDLFRCFVSIIKSGAEQDRAGIFVAQLGILVQRLRHLLPRLTRGEGRGRACQVSEDVGMLLGLDPGIYNINTDALTCSNNSKKEAAEQPTQIPTVEIEPAQALVVEAPPTTITLFAQQPLADQLEITAPIKPEEEFCSRVNPIDKWTLKRVWKQKMNKHTNKEEQTSNYKKIKLTDLAESHIEPGIENTDNASSSTEYRDKTLDSLLEQNKELQMETEVASKKSKGSHIQFHSAHFDIRSSPIKPSATIFNKFQIIPEKLASSNQVQMLRPLTFTECAQSSEDSLVAINKLCNLDTTERNGNLDFVVNCPQATSTSDSQHSLDLQGILKELSTNSNNILDNTDLTSKETDVLDSIEFDNKTWSVNNSVDQTPESYIKSSLIEQTMFHEKDPTNDDNTPANFNESSMNFSDNSITPNDISIANTNVINDNGLTMNQGHSVLQFLDSLGSDLSCPESEMRNNAIDFQLDLFSFNNT